MPLINFLSLTLPAPIDRSSIRRADLVFHIADCNGGVWARKKFAHVGIAAQDAEGHHLNNPVMVYHMARVVEREQWADGATSDSSRIDLCGTSSEIDDTVRIAILDTALSYYQSSPSILNDWRECFWMGDPQPDSHPRFPNVDNAYGFSCATFAHYCYEQALPKNNATLVRIETMPETTPSELAALKAVFRDHVDDQSFRRLYHGYLLGAFENDQFPFEPSDWDDWKDHGRYVPLVT